MTDANFSLTHPDAETLAAFVDGRLDRDALPPLLTHLERCPECIGHLRVANEELAYAKGASARTWWWLAAAAVLLAVLALPLVRHFRASPAERLVALAPRSLRAVEPRLSGGFAWAPYRGPARASDSESQAAHLRLQGVAGELLERAERDPSARAQQEAGVGLVLIGEPEQAVERLRAATKANARDARAWSDLAAAQYVAAVQLGRPSVYAEALAAADAALRLDPRFREALFNRALTLEALGLTNDARTAWQRYLEIDAGSPWAVEARTRLSRLPVATGDSRFRQQLPALEHAAANGDSARVETIVRQHRLQARVYGEAEHLGQWGTSGSPRPLSVARAVGDALRRLGGERLLHDAVAAIDGAPDARVLADAHARYRRGRIAYSRQQLASAERDLREATVRFERGRSPMALVARYYAASARYDRNEVEAAERELETLLAEIPPHYVALRAQVRWQLALCHMQRNDWAGALPLVREAGDAFAALDERSNLAFLQTLLADTLMSLGRPDEAWTARIESFRIASAEGRSNRLSVSLGGAGRMELRAGRLDAARALLQLEIAAEQTPGSEFLLTNALARAAMLAAASGDGESAATQLRKAESVAARLADPSLRDRANVDVELARGAALLHVDTRDAHDALSRAIDGYARGGKPVMLPECHLLRARARLAVGDRGGARADLDRGIELLERQHIPYAGAVIGTGIYDAGRALFREAVSLAADEGEPAAAFAYAERSRAQLGSGWRDVRDLQERLRGSGTVVLQVIVLDLELVTVAVSEDELLLTRYPLPRADAVRLAATAVRRDATDTRAVLYNAIVRGTEPLLARARHVVFVADPLLEGVPFAALYDTRTRRFLLHRATVSRALSASSLDVMPRRGRPHSAVAVTLRSGRDAGSPALPRAAREAAELRSLYPRAAEAPPTLAAIAAAAGADVVHISGHTRRQSGAGASALALDGGGASWENIAAAPRAPRGTVVLAACDTLGVSTSPQIVTFSVGAGFVAAGAAEVIGTLGEIRDEDAYTLFRTIHRELAAGADGPSAVRSAQTEALAGGQDVDWQAIAVLTRHIPHD